MYPIFHKSYELTTGSQVLDWSTRKESLHLIHASYSQMSCEVRQIRLESVLMSALGTCFCCVNRLEVIPSE